MPYEEKEKKKNNYEKHKCSLVPYTKVYTTLTQHKD